MYAHVICPRRLLDFTLCHSAILLGDYAKAVILYYPVSILYFFIGFTLYAFIAGGKRGIVKFWKNILTPAATALGTGSSFATLPVNLDAAKNIGIPKDIRETVLPLGATIHMSSKQLIKQATNQKGKV